MSFEEKYLLIEETPYNRVAVVDSGAYRLLRFGLSEQSSMSLTNPLESGFEYTDYFHLPVLFGVALRRALFIGLGGGMGIKMYRHHYPDAQIDAVEIDPVVVQAARQYFYVEEDDHFRIHIEDGGKYLQRTAEKYDVVILDAYTVVEGKSGPPEHLMEPEFFRGIHEHLAETGMLIFNLTGTSWGEPTKRLLAVLREVFASAYQFNVRSSLNVALVGSMAPAVGKKELRRRALALRDRRGPLRLTFMDMANGMVENP